MFPGSSNDEWIIYTLCISGFTILAGVGHLLRKIRKRRSLKLKINAEVDLKPLKPTPYIGIYSEVDKNPLTFDTTELNVASQASSMKSINFISKRRRFITTEIEDEETTGYLDVYFDMENDNTKVVDGIPHIESLSTNSFNSGVVGQDNTEYFKPYTKLQGNCQEDSNACEVTVTVHQCSESSLRSEEEAMSNIYSNVYQPMQTDKQIHIQENENLLSPEITTLHDPALQAAAYSSVYKTCNVQDCTKKFVKSEKTIDSVCTIESIEDKSLDEEKSKTL
ncbi:unnamed protein product [Mytilus coruscus]|uniref:Uncharacterized protein n=1 Tax=Mytilus coruscus TaxID=42192 RepID=A0A6J8CZ82_MYTCO|nr:unnamed protein product [Mytilus coruscus]